MSHNAELGRRGEDLAAEHLEARGFRLIDRNWRCRHGEIDVVAAHRACTVFVEVKTRASERYGHPFEAITPVKLVRLRRLAAMWCEAKGTAAGPPRIDAVAVLLRPGAAAVVEHLEGIG
jgi:putative endonuclease